MTSIFIWEADSQPPTDCSMIRYDRGADWSLEESGESYQWIRQVKGDSYLHYTAKRMPTDWMGDYWLESVVVPHHTWKEEDGIRWDQLGIWNRWIGPDTGLPVEVQWDTAQRWCRGESVLVVAPSASLTPSVPRHSGRGEERDIEYRTRTMYPPYPERSQGVHGGGGSGGRGRGGRGGEGSGGRGRGGRGRGGRGRGRANIRI